MPEAVVVAGASVLLFALSSRGTGPTTYTLAANTPRDPHQPCLTSQVRGLRWLNAPPPPFQK